MSALIEKVNATEPGTGPVGSLQDRLRLIKHVALDMDGTIYRGGTLFEFTNGFLTWLTELDIGYTFLTNNSSRSAKDHRAHLRRLGVSVPKGQLLTSTQATLDYLHQALPAVRKIFVLGTASMRDEIAAAGYALASDSATDEPDAVVAGFDTELTFARLCRAAWWIKQGKPYLASHPDYVCPTDAPTLLVDCGSVCAALQAATGRAPDVILGKPDPWMLHDLLQRTALRPDQLAMVGDRLYTDMAMASNAGALGVLVLTGEATAAEAALHQPPPDLVVKNLAEFGEQLRAARAGKAF
jgi:HAD superfamily hydrolase (TIGR01450 family)